MFTKGKAIKVGQAQGQTADTTEEEGHYQPGSWMWLSMAKNVSAFHITYQQHRRVFLESGLIRYPGMPECPIEKV